MYAFFFSLSFKFLLENLRTRYTYIDFREDHRLGVFENRVLRRIFGPKRCEVIGGWRKLRNDELHNLYPWPNIITMIKSRRMR
jgi:hypothetical protein